MLEVNRRGCTRDVLLINNYAIKFPSIASDWRHFLFGMIANDREVRLSADQEFVYNQYLNPVLFSLPLGLLTVQKRATPINYEDWLLHHENIKLMSRNWTLSEEKIDSYGWVDGKIVIIDYGN